MPAGTRDWIDSFSAEPARSERAIAPTSRPSCALVFAAACEPAIPSAISASVAPAISENLPSYVSPDAVGHPRGRARPTVLPTGAGDGEADRYFPLPAGLDLDLRCRPENQIGRA